MTILVVLREWVRGLTLERVRAAGGWAWQHRTPILAALVVVLVATNARSCRRASTAESQAAAAAARASHEAKAEGAGIPVVRETAPADVKAELERLLSENSDLRAQHERDQRVMGKLRAELVARIRTEPAPARVPVAQGEPLRLDADLAVNGTTAGAHLLEGTLSAWSGPDLVVRQPFSHPVTVAVMAPACPDAPTSSERRWRLGPIGGGGASAGGGGWLLGAAGTYRLDLWGYRPEVLATAAAGPGGVFAAVGPLF